MCFKIKQWQHCLSLGSAALVSAHIGLFICLWNIFLVFFASSVQRSFIEDALKSVIFFFEQGPYISPAYKILGMCLLGISLINIIIYILSLTCIIFSISIISYILCWLYIINGIFALIVILFYWTAYSLLLLKVPCTLGELVFWDSMQLWICIIIAIPMIKIYASIGNIQKCGGFIFKKNSCEDIIKNEKKYKNIKNDNILGVSSLGTYTIGLNLNQGVFIYSIITFSMCVLNFSLFWNQLQIKNISSRHLSIILMVEGLLLFFISISAVLGAIAVLPFMTFLAFIFSLLSLPIVFFIIFFVIKYFILEILNTHHIIVYNMAAINCVTEQIVFFFISIYMIRVLYSLFTMQTIQAVSDYNNNDNNNNYNNDNINDNKNYNNNNNLKNNNDDADEHTALLESIT